MDSRKSDEEIKDELITTGIVREKIKVRPFIPNELANPYKTGNSAKKFDNGKTRLDLVPPEINMAIGEILTFGANKYGDRNWEKGMEWGRVYGALQRHLNAWWSGENLDEETGKSHLWHAACCISFLVTFEERDIGEDDRWIRGRDY